MGMTRSQKVRVEFMRRLKGPPSGLDAVGKRVQPSDLTPSDAARLAIRLRADELTYRRYADVDTVPAWEALALHYRLDPLVLDFFQGGQREFLDDLSRLLPHDHPLRHFTSAVQILECGIAVPGFSSASSSEALTLSSQVRLKDFAGYLSFNRVGSLVGVKFSRLEPALVWEASDLLDQLLRVNQEVRSGRIQSKELPKTLENLKWSDTLAGAGATILRTAQQRRGGRPRG